MPNLRTPPKAVAYLKEIDPETPVTLAALRIWLHQGKINYVKLGKTYLVNMDSLEEFLKGTA